MALSNFNGILLSDLTAFDGISSISAINGISATIGSDVTAPTLSSATVAANGTTLTLVFSEAVSQGVGYADADLNLDASTTGADLGLTYVSGDGTNTWVYTIGSTIQSGETVDLDFNGDVDSIEDGAGNDLAAIVSGAVTNDSTQGGSGPDILWWKLNEGSGTSITADVGQNGTTDADWSASTQSGSGSCLDFTPANSDDAVSSSNITYVSDVCTLMFWIYLDDVSTFRGILRSDSTADSTDKSYSIYLQNGVGIAGQIYGSGGNVRTESITMPSASAWHHLAFVFNNSTTAGDVKIYLDGSGQKQEP